MKKLYNIIHTEQGHIVVDSTRLAKEGELNFNGLNIVKVELDKSKLYGNGCNPIIATMSPFKLTTTPMIIERSVEELAKIKFPEGHPLALDWQLLQKGFIEGYKAAKFKSKQYSKEDVIDIIKDIQTEYDNCGKSFETAKTVWEVCENKIDYLKSLRSTTVELEVETIWKRNTDRNIPTKDDLDEVLKTESTPEGLIIKL